MPELDQNTILLLGAVGIGIYMFMQKGREKSPSAKPQQLADRLADAYIREKTAPDNQDGVAYQSQISVPMRITVRPEQETIKE